jgi:uncharacterized protein with von Willebrand factor type A (vWA) domain
VPGLGWGAEPGQLQRALLERVEPFVRLLAQLPELRALAERLGRVEHDARARRRGEGGSEEVAGVRMSGDATRALPSELALLGDAATEDLFYARWLERQLVSLELAGRGLDGSGAPGRRGPVIAALDTSGSMNGEPGRLAKATLIAVMRQVVPQGRAVHVLLFGAAGELRELRVGGGRSAGGLDALIELCGLSFGGGTDFDTPLARALDLLDERAWERADLLVVTDGLGAASPALEARVADAVARRGVRCVTVLVGEDTHGVRGFSGEIWPLSAWLQRVR